MLIIDASRAVTRSKQSQLSTRVLVDGCRGCEKDAAILGIATIHELRLPMKN
jgi:hypothetical protein